jgi:hypothetical protein
MYRIRILIISLLAFFVSSGCMLCGSTGPGKRVTVAGSGDVVTREIDVADFERVEASDAFQIKVRQGASYRVVVRVDQALQGYLDVAKEGRTLKIGLKRGPRYDIRDAVQEAEVMMPALSGLHLSGASQAVVNGFSSTRDLDVHLTGASGLRGDVEAGDVAFHLSGASNVTLAGYARALTLAASGASQVHLAELTVEDAEVKVSGASTVTVNPSGRLDVRASGASHVYYVGDPTLGEVHKSGASSVASK